MAPVTGKRKREEAQTKANVPKKSALKKGPANGEKKQTAVQAKPTPKADPKPSSRPEKSTAAPQNGTHDRPLAIQIVTGSYERVLHGLSASIPQKLLQSNGATDTSPQVIFSDTFLFAAHASSIRCLAISPPTDADKRYLATGSSDERINVYSISTAPPTTAKNLHIPSLSSTSTALNPANRSLGSLIHHDRAITRLEFPAKGKLFSSAEDNTIAISRTRDWTVLSSIKAPIPTALGRPSGDTAAPGEVPTGVNDFSIHPSQKLMLTVSRGERSMRLWNLMTGKKAGVLNFERDLLAQVGEGKHSTGEGRRVVWDEVGENYVVGFERGAVVFGIDSQPKAVVKPTTPTKLHQYHVVSGVKDANLLAVSTEDGRVLFYDLDSTSAVPTQGDGKAKTKLPQCACIAQLGGRDAGVSGRIKDFDIVRLPSGTVGANFIAITASSDGAVRLWSLRNEDLKSESLEAAAKGSDKAQTAPKQVGGLIATHESGNRITCLGAFVMDGTPGKVDAVEDGAEEDEASSSDGE